MNLECFDRDIYALPLVDLFNKYPHISFKIYREPTDSIDLPPGMLWCCDCGCGEVTPEYHTVGHAYTADASESVMSCSLEIGLTSPCIEHDGEYFGVHVYEEDA